MNSIRAIYPLYPPWRFESENHHLIFKNLVRDFQNARNIGILDTGRTYKDGLQVQIKPFESELKKFIKSPSIVSRSEWVLEFSGNFRFPGAEVFFLTDQNGERTNDSDDELQELWLSWLPEELGLTIHSFNCALMIAYPGAARPIDNFWFIDGEPIDHQEYFLSSIHEAVEFFCENGLPFYSDIDSEEVVRWVFSQNGISKGYSDTPASRGLSFFTRLFVKDFRNDEMSDLVWAVAGVEALLVEGGRSSLGQLKSKIAALFPDPKTLPWLLSMTEKLYSYRSKMIHGNRNLRSAFRHNEEEENEGRFREEYDSQLFASGLLLALLRYTISNKKPAIKFKTILDED